MVSVLLHPVAQHRLSRRGDGLRFENGTTPYEFGKAVATQNTYGAADVKWMPSLGLWVCTDYTEGAEQGGYEFDSVRIGFSKDGLNFSFTNEPLSRPIQDYTAKTCHNPGFIGNEYGYGFETMFLTYGVNDFSLRRNGCGLADGLPYARLFESDLLEKGGVT